MCQLEKRSQWQPIYRRPELVISPVNLFHSTDLEHHMKNMSCFLASKSHKIKNLHFLVMFTAPLTKLHFILCSLKSIFNSLFLAD